VRYGLVRLGFCAYIKDEIDKMALDNVIESVMDMIFSIPDYIILIATYPFIQIAKLSPGFKIIILLILLFIAFVIGTYIWYRRKDMLTVYA